MKESEAFYNQTGGPKKPGNMNDWAEALRGVNPMLSTRLNEKRSVGFENVEKLGLPRYEKKVMSLSNFLKDNSEILSNMHSSLFYISLVPVKQGLRRFGKAGIDAGQVLEYIEENIKKEQVDNYEIIVQQYFENLYGGNIVINPDGHIHVEFKAGQQGPIAKGTHAPDFTANSGNFTNSLKYSFKDENLRAMIFKTLQSIPHSGEGREAVYSPGYYEFIIVKRDRQTNEEPIFIDYRNNPAYNLPEQE